MYRFHIPTNWVPQSTIELDLKESRHAISVLRLKNGDVVELLDGKSNKYQGIVAGQKNGKLLVAINQNIFCPEPKILTTLAISVIKPERMELLIEKACELGVSEIQPLITDRCVIKLSPERWQAKAQRWSKIAEATCKQCGQSRTPTVLPVTQFKNYLDQFKNFDLAIIPTLAKQSQNLKQVFKEQNPKNILVLIGPEGDFTSQEIELALDRGAKSVSLGTLVMRSETAAMHVLAIINFHFTI